MAAGIAIKQLIDEKRITGTVKVYGCPAEEGGSGKVYMVREGLFKGVDAVIHWHPDNQNGVTMMSALANSSAKFRFHGLSAHASGAPERGRSALDAVEAMDHMVNMMREHVPSATRIHYVITNGGPAFGTVTISFLTYLETFSYGHVGRGAARCARAASGSASARASSPEMPSRSK